MEKSKKIFGLFIGSSALAILLRLMAMLSNKDSNGLYIDQTRMSILLLKIVVVFSCLAFLVTAFIDKVPFENRSRNKDNILGLFMVFLGGVIMFDGLVDFFNIFQLIWSSDLGELKNLIATTPNAKLKLNVAVLTFVSGWMITTVAIKVLNKAPIHKNYFVMVIFSWCLIMRVMCFMNETNTIVKVPDNLYSILTMICSIPFWFACSRLLFDCEYKSGYRLAVSAGFLTAFFGLLSTIPNYIAFFLGKNEFFSMKDTNGIYDLIVSIFSIAFLYVILFSKGEDAKKLGRQEENILEENNLSEAKNLI